MLSYSLDFSPFLIESEITFAFLVLLAFLLSLIDNEWLAFSVYGFPCREVGPIRLMVLLEGGLPSGGRERQRVIFFMLLLIAMV